MHNVRVDGILQHCHGAENRAEMSGIRIIVKITIIRFWDRQCATTKDSVELELRLIKHVREPIFHFGTVMIYISQKAEITMKGLWCIQDNSVSRNVLLYC